MSSAYETKNENIVKCITNFLFANNALVVVAKHHNLFGCCFNWSFGIYLVGYFWWLGCPVDLHSCIFVICIIQVLVFVMVILSIDFMSVVVLRNNFVPIFVVFSASSFRVSSPRN